YTLENTGPLGSQNSNSAIMNLLSVIGIDIHDYIPTVEFNIVYGYVGIDTEFNFDFSIQGSPSGNHLVGRGGVQTFTGGSGYDRIYSGGDNDIIIASEGGDFID